MPAVVPCALRSLSACGCLRRHPTRLMRGSGDGLLGNCILRFPTAGYRQLLLHCSTAGIHAGVHARVKTRAPVADLRIIMCPWRASKRIRGMIAVWIAGALLLGLAVSRIGLPPRSVSSRRVSCSRRSEWSPPTLDDLAYAGVLAAAVRCGLEASHQDAAALRGVGHGDLASPAYRHHRRRRGSDRRLARAGPGARVGRQLLVSRAPCSRRSARWQSRAPRRARPRRDRHPRSCRTSWPSSCSPSSTSNAVAFAAAAAGAVRAPGDRLAACRCGHGELLVLFGAALAIGGGEGFEALGLSAELGALLSARCSRTTSVRRAHERAVEPQGAVPRRVFFGHRLQRAADLGSVVGAFWLVALLPVKGAIFFLLLIGLGLRAARASSRP